MAVAGHLTKAPDHLWLERLEIVGVSGPWLVVKRFTTGRQHVIPLADAPPWAQKPGEMVNIRIPPIDAGQRKPEHWRIASWEKVPFGCLTSNQRLWLIRHPQLRAELDECYCSYGDEGTCKVDAGLFPEDLR